MYIHTHVRENASNDLSLSEYQSPESVLSPVKRIRVNNPRRILLRLYPSNGLENTRQLVHVINTSPVLFSSPTRYYTILFTPRASVVRATVKVAFAVAGIPANRTSAHRGPALFRIITTRLKIYRPAANSHFRYLEKSTRPPLLKGPFLSPRASRNYSFFPPLSSRTFAVRVRRLYVTKIAYRRPPTICLGAGEFRKPIIHAIGVNWTESRSKSAHAWRPNEKSLTFDRN